MSQSQTTTSTSPSALNTLTAPVRLPCGLALPNALVKCPMQETLAQAPLYDPPVNTFSRLYTRWAHARYGLIITGQVQIDPRFLSVPGDVCTHPASLQSPHINKWKRWARLSKADGTPSIVQLAHPGRMSPAGAGNRPRDMPAWCPSSVPVEMGNSWVDKLARDKLLGTPKAISRAEIDEVVGLFVHGAKVAVEAGFDGVQIHGAHGFLVSQFLSPHTNRRTDEYGGEAWRRMALLRRLVKEIRAVVPKPLCLSVKLNSADYMEEGKGLQIEEGLGQVKWLVECGMVDFAEISGGNAENKTSGLHQSFGKKSMDKAPKRKESTRIREAFFTEFAEKVQDLGSDVPIQLSGGFRSRVGMADAVECGTCQMIGLGRTAVLEPELPVKTLLNPDVSHDEALGMSHQVKGQWIISWMPSKIVGSGLGIQFFYANMRRMGHGLDSDPNLSIPKMMVLGIIESLTGSLSSVAAKLLMVIPWGYREKLG